jgi:hypothetical protein
MKVAICNLVLSGILVGFDENDKTEKVSADYLHRSDGVA